MDFATLMTLEPHGPDTFVGTGPRYQWGGLYGGQIVAQGLRAASLTVDPGFFVHSLHAYFIRRGNDQEPIRFEVDRVRNGRSFVTRNVIARQSIGAILSMSTSFQVDEAGPVVQTAVMPEVLGPDGIESDSWSPMFERSFVPGGRRPGKAQAWLRMVEPVGDDTLLQACALAYVSDDLPTDAVVTLHPDDIAHDDFEAGRYWSASLDHAIWFHRPLLAEHWHLHDFSCHGYLGSRGLSLGHVLSTDGAHVATIAQEVLFRSAKP
ncbi:MAG: acyl-CoA thioesterase [Acidimicrobiales bacterium]